MTQKGRDVLERAFPPPADAFDRLARRRTRRVRSRRTAAVGLALVIGVAGFGLIASAFHRGAEQPASNASLTPTDVSNLKLAWSFGTGASIDSSPVVAGDRVYVTPSSGGVFVFSTSCGSADGTCAPIWRAEGTGPGGSPTWGSATIADGRVYVGGSDGRLLGYPTSCGGPLCQPVWVARTGGSLATASPVVSNGVVYAGSEDGKVYAFAEACGSYPEPCRPLWSASLGGGFEGGTPVVVDGVLWVGSKSGTLYAFPTSCGGSTATCAPVWRMDTSGVGAAPFGATIVPLAAGDRFVYMASGRNLYAFAAGCAQAPYPSCGSWVGHTWSSIGSALVGDGYVAVSSFDTISGEGRIFVFPESCGSGAATCRPVWTSRSRAESYANPIAKDGVLYAGFEHGIEAFPADCWAGGGTCAPIWTSPQTGSVNATPAIANGTVFATSEDGRVYAFNVQGGPASRSNAGALSEARPGPGTGYAYFYLGVLAVGGASFWVIRRRRSNGLGS